MEDQGAVLLVRRNIEPFYGMWDIPGGYLHEWEHPAEGARREVAEETGLQVELTRLLGIFIDRYGDNPQTTFNVYYRGRVLRGTLAPADDASEAHWFSADALPAEIAFPGHIPEVLAVWRAAQAAEPDPDPAGDPALVLHVSADVRRPAVDPR
ncbi:MAG TPA: NUDIX hydrolase [Chloroflexia bacterium]|nr:NUDIX hydrolase [Chloroflexia bacterium]